jgi:hypothetical protein
LASELALLVLFQGCSKLISFVNTALLDGEVDEAVAFKQVSAFSDLKKKQV